MIDVIAEFPDWKTCDRARLARDRDYDGVFFSGVKSTGIYCRPVCPVRLQNLKMLISIRLRQRQNRPDFVRAFDAGLRPHLVVQHGWGQRRQLDVPCA